MSVFLGLAAWAFFSGDSVGRGLRMGADRAAVWVRNGLEWAIPAVGESLRPDPARAVRMVMESLPRYRTVEHEARPRVSWVMTVRSWVFTLTGYDFSQPGTFLEVELPGYASVAKAQRETLRGPAETGFGVADGRLLPPADGAWPLPGNPAPALPQPGTLPDGSLEPVLPGTPPDAKIPTTREEVLATADWGDQPLIAIIHSHPSEMYRTDTFAPANAHEFHLFDTADTGIVRAGARLADALWERYGIPTVHDTTLHNTPCHNCAYRESRKTVQELLRKYPSLMYVLDVHRDGAENVSMLTTVESEMVAQVAIVVGRPAAGDEGRHPNWSANQAFAQRLGALMNTRYPGILRRVLLLNGVYNQDLHPRFVLLEVGNYFDHETNALRTADLLADVLAEALFEDRFGLTWSERLTALTGIGITDR